MKPLYDTASVCRTLRDGIAKGYWTEENLNQKSAGRILLEQEMKTHKVVELRSFELPPHRNLLNDYYPETVQAAPDPRDFDANPGAPVQRGEPQLHVQGEETPVVSDLDPVARHDGAGGAADSGDQASVGAAGEPPASTGGITPLWSRRAELW